MAIHESATASIDRWRRGRYPLWYRRDGTDRGDSLAACGSSDGRAALGSGPAAASPRGENFETGWKASPRQRRAASSEPVTSSPFGASHWRSRCPKCEFATSSAHPVLRDLRGIAEGRGGKAEWPNSPIINAGAAPLRVSRPAAERVGWKTKSSSSRDSPSSRRTR